jgi:hypothetical protein
MPIIDPKCVKHIFASETFTSEDWNPRRHQYEKFFSNECSSFTSFKISSILLIVIVIEMEDVALAYPLKNNI